MRYPEYLQKNGTIGLIAPSFGAASEPYISRTDHAIEVFKARGFQVTEGPNTRVCEGIGKSNTPEKCGAEINDFFINERSDVIISCGGGELMCEDLEYVDFEGIAKAKPQWFLGYSDNTNLTALLPTLCDTAAIYGPCVGDLGMEPWHPSIEDAFAMLTGEKTMNRSVTVHNYDGWEAGWPDREVNPTAPYNITDPYQQILIPAKGASTFRSSDWRPEKNNGKELMFAGRMIGGCLDCLTNLSGTRFDRMKEFCERYKEDGIVWFLEACDLNPMGIRRALWQLDMTGWFRYVKGFIIGRSLHYQEDFDGFTCRDAYASYLAKFEVPMVLDVDLGHLSPMMPIISGSVGKIHAKNNEFSLKMELI